ncbi:MAG TPA: hypothetical protein VF076_02995, partial [Acidimicrobiales bacterium]
GLVVLAGLVTGAVAAWALATVLVRVLTGVFDPPPASLAVPWTYLAAVASIIVAATAVAAIAAIWAARSYHLELLRTP